MTSSEKTRVAALMAEAACRASLCTGRSGRATAAVGAMSVDLVKIARIEHFRGAISACYVQSHDVTRPWLIVGERESLRSPTDRH